MRRDKLPVTDTQILLLAEFTLPAPPGYQTDDKPETLGTSDSLAAAGPRAGARRKTDGSQKPIYNVKDRTRRLRHRQE